MNIKMIVKAASMIATTYALVGCATITRGTKEALVVESEPSGADVFLSTGPYGKTPTSFKVRRKHGFDVTIKKEGYETIIVQITPQISGGGAAGMAGNLIFGGIIGAAVDASSGGTKELKPNPIKVVLEKTNVQKIEEKPFEPIVNDEGKSIHELVADEWKRVNPTQKEETVDQ